MRTRRKLRQRKTKTTLLAENKHPAKQARKQVNRIATANIAHNQIEQKTHSEYRQKPKLRR
jgi:hypothetical protein